MRHARLAACLTIGRCLALRHVLVAQALVAGLDAGAGPARLPAVRVGEFTTCGAERPDFVAAAGRIAVFDNDGTLWCEQPIYSAR